jgi:hypothetical protein
MIVFAKELAEIIAVYGSGVVAALLLGGLLIKLAKDLFRTAST